MEKNKASKNVVHVPLLPPATNEVTDPVVDPKTQDVDGVTLRGVDAEEGGEDPSARKRHKL